ncbi:hypothetical protein Tco_1039880, partial [Tanacetum coccineum]
MIPPVFSPFYNNLCLKEVQAFYAKESPISPPAPIIPQTVLTPSPHHEEQIKDILNYLEELSFHRIEKIKEGHINDRMIIQKDGNKLKNELKRVRSQIIKLQRKQLGQRDKIAFAHFIISDLEQIIEEIQARNIRRTGTPVSKNGKLLSFVRCQPFYFNGMEGAVGLIRWFERTKSVFSRSNCAGENKVAFATVMKMMEDEFYNLAVKGNDLKTYIRRFQELAVLCPNMVPNTEKLMEVFISGLPRSIEGNVTASKPQTLEELTNIAQRLMDQIIRHDSVQETNNHKRKLEDKRNIINNNNYQNNYNNNNRNNDYHQQQNRRQETFRTYAATNGYTGNHPLCE